MLWEITWFLHQKVNHRVALAEKGREATREVCEFHGALLWELHGETASLFPQLC